MSIDPSINNLGMAIWDLSKHDLMYWQLLHPKKEYRENEYDKSWSMFTQIKECIKTYEVNRIICEVPEHWAVAGFQARETGSIQKLMFVCGMIYSLKDEMDSVQLVSPRGWKGQLPKDVVANRLKEDYKKYDIDMTKIDSNVMDAIGIGHFHIYGSV